MASKALAALVVLVLLAGGKLGHAVLVSGRPPVSTLPHPSSSTTAGQATNMNAMDGASAATTHRQLRIGEGEEKSISVNSLPTVHMRVPVIIPKST
ncbi:hypothetical protein CFC21_074782 [Triticum aestivum]|uniref:Uncharacterized protein n=2 Tax=Triticum aestivum TaxID=4565 RepID=A0A9R1KWQ5_WHEAT|nr:hypothetical protein CFC21_074782 [Triticum aestivum]